MSAGAGTHADASPPAPGFLAGTAMRVSLVAAALYSLAMALAWAAFSSQMPVDWGLELILSQELKPIYPVPNPPLFTWIAWALQRVMPPSQWVHLIICYSATFAFFCLYAFAGHRVLRNRQLAALAPWSMFLIVHYRRLNFGYVNTQLLLPLIAASVVLLLALGRRPRWTLFVALGLVVGLGTLSKLNYLFCIVCLLAAACVQPRLRAGLFRPWLALSLLLALAVIAPFASAFHEAGNDLLALLHSKTGAGVPASYAAQLGMGLASAGEGAVNYLGPALLIGLAGVLCLRGVPRDAGELASERRFLRDALVAGLVVILAGIVFFGIADIKLWYLYAFFLPAPLYALTFWDVERIPRMARLALFGVVLGFAVVPIALRFLEFTPYCIGKCRDIVPYGRLVRHLREAGFERGTILSIGARVAGNLRAHFPASRTGLAAGSTGPALLPPRPPGPIGQCLVIWRDDEVESQAAARRQAAQTLIALRLVEEAGDTPVRMVRFALRGWPAAGRPGRAGFVVWRYILIRKGNARCG